MIFSLLTIHNYDRRSSITRVLHTATWDYFTPHLPHRFICSPRVVKEAIITDINGLVQEFWTRRTSTDEVNGESIYAMHRLHEILRRCLDVCFFLATAFDLADKI
jgi:hypothetical protein